MSRPSMFFFEFRKNNLAYGYHVKKSTSCTVVVMYYHINNYVRRPDGSAPSLAATAAAGPAGLLLA
jgi:hypothetical protein